jgi:hypothetical protein
MTNRRITRSAVIAATVFGALAVGAPTADAHTHPTPADVTGPGVVYIQSGYHVRITAVEHDMNKSVIHYRNHTYDVVLARGSGFVVEQSAVIVTSAATVTASKTAAENFAINSLFASAYAPGSAPPEYPEMALPVGQLPKDRYTQGALPSGIGVNPHDYSAVARLKACYESEGALVANTAGGCVIDATPFYTVYPYVTNQDKYGKLDARLITSTSSGVALLRVSAGSMPAVDLEDVNKDTFHLGVIGFDAPPISNGPPGGAIGLENFKVHLDKPGGTKLKTPIGDTDDLAKITSTMLDHGLQGAPVAAEVGQVVGMIVKTPTGGPALVRTQEIRAALAGARPPVTPAQAPADLAFSTAEHEFTNKGYAAAIPGFQQALAAYPGNFLAVQHLATARRLAGTGPAPAPSTSARTLPHASGAKGGFTWWPWLLIGAALLGVGTLAVFFFGRRRMRADPGDRSGSADTAIGTSAAPRRDGSGRGVKPDGRASAAADNVAQSGQRSRPVSRAESAGEALSTARAASRTAERPRGESASFAFCTNCGGRLAQAHQFCGWCGEPVG